MENRNLLQVFNGLLYRQFFDQTYKVTGKQIVVPDSLIDGIISTLHHNPMQGHSEAYKMLKVLRPTYYSADMTRKVRQCIENCLMCIRAKPCPNTKLRPPPEPTYDPCDGPEDVKEISFIKKVPASNGYILIACDVSSRYLFAVPLRPLSDSAVTPPLLQIFVQHEFVPKHILTDKGSAFASQVNQL